MRTTLVHKRITLINGMTVSVAMSMDLSKLDPMDRAFVFDIIDRVNEYERRNPGQVADVPEAGR
jgi:hypothetical protein